MRPLAEMRQRSAQIAAKVTVQAEPQQNPLQSPAAFQLLINDIRLVDIQGMKLFRGD